MTAIGRVRGETRHLGVTVTSFVVCQEQDYSTCHFNSFYSLLILGS